MDMSLEPTEEVVGSDPRYQWALPLTRPGTTAAAAPAGRRRPRSVWYVALPLTSAHRGGHSGGGALISGAGGQERYRNEGTVYPHAALVEMITYQERCFPDTAWSYLDMSHVTLDEARARIAADPPDVVAFTVYTSTALWAFIMAAEVKRVNPEAVVVFGNDHAGILHREVLTGPYGSRLVDFVSTGNNGPFTMMGLLYALRGELDLARVPSLAYRHGDRVINQPAPTYPLDRRLLPDYRLIKDQLEQYYDEAFKVWYAHHYTLKRMVTLPLDGGCTWGRRPGRRCKHCSIQGLTPKTSSVAAAVPVLESMVGELGANVYAAGDSTLGLSRDQWSGEIGFLDDLAEACAASPVLREHRFMLAYGLVYEFLQSARLCQGFIRTWNVGLEAFDPKLLKGDSKGINKGPDRVLEALELARDLDYKLYVSGIMGLPGTTLDLLRSEVDHWLSLAETYRDSITTISVAAPGVIPGSRMYWESYTNHPQVRAAHGETVPARRLTELYVRENTEVTLADVEAAIAEVGRGVIALGEERGHMKFGGYMLGGVDEEEALERRLLDDLCGELRHP
ncbi:B12-binding domain-containing radical SAM protein [Streptomyces sp. URMC 123]|uniref:B12-binding domain-containing radical SAM protein n=1 Tax=Streptomyces sp. URMC 123 TaxID=3423403 RepID=UPI003F1B7711